MANLQVLATEVYERLYADDDRHDALMLASLRRFFQAWDMTQAANVSTGAVQHPNRDA